MMEGMIYMGAMILLLVGSVVLSDARDALFAGGAGMRACAGDAGQHDPPGSLVAAVAIVAVRGYHGVWIYIERPQWLLWSE